MINHYNISKLCFAVLSVILFSCNSNTQTNGNAGNTDQQASIQTADSDTNGTAASNNINRDFTYSFKNEAQKFSFPNRQAKEINLPSGTRINVPENCFVDKNGAIANGTVDLFFEEFLTAGSIISSQINMKYDSAGNVSDFESAGMFRINASQKGEQLFMAKGKAIDVSLATTDSDKGFNAYYSKADGSDWTYLNKSTATPNTAKGIKTQAITQQLASVVKPMPPASYSANGKYFDLNLSHLYTHDLKSLLGIVWEYAGNDKKKDPAVNKTNFDRNWDFVNISPSQGTKRGVYDIVLQNKDTTIKTSARPVFRGAVLDAENEEFIAEIGEFNQRMNQLKNEQKQNQAEASFLRVIAVKNLGLYNYDRQYHETDMTPVLANFNFGADSLKNYPITVYLVTGNGMAVIKYPPHDWEKFMYARKDINKLIAILPNQEICTFSAQRFRKEGPNFPEKSPGRYTFLLHHTGLKATNSQDIDRVLSTI